MYGKTEAQAGWDDRHLNTKLRWTQAVWLEFLLLRSAHCYRFTGNKGTEEHVKWYYRDTFHKAQNVGNFTGQMTHVLQQVNCQYLDHFSVIFAKWCWGKRKSIPQGQTASMLTSCYKNCGFLKFSVPLQNTFIESAGVHLTLHFPFLGLREKGNQYKHNVRAAFSALINKVLCLWQSHVLCQPSGSH